MKRENFVTTVKNQYDIEVKQCCLSCEYQTTGRRKKQKYCRKTHSNVARYGLCREWAMSRGLRAAGSGLGVVRDIVTKEVIIY